MPPKRTSSLSRRTPASKRKATERLYESEDKRTKRRKKDKDRHMTARQQESEEERARRLTKDKDQHTTARQQESEEERARRLADQRERWTTAAMRPASRSYFRSPGAAFSYDQTKPYDNDPIINIGSPSVQCIHCTAKKYPGETPGMCCSGGKVRLPLLSDPPEPLQSLLNGQSTKSKTFLNNISSYNAAFQMTSFGASKEITHPGYMPTFKVQGQVYHLIGSLLPQSNEKAKFLQVYFVGDSQQECDSRCQNFQHLDKDVVLDLQEMLHANNVLVQSFKMTIDQQLPAQDFRVVIQADKRPAGEHPRRFNAPSVNEVAILMVGDQHDRRDIVIHPRGNCLMRVSETHRSYDALQYPLIFWQGQDGYHFNIPQVHPNTGEPMGNKKVSANDFYAYMLMIRPDTSNFLLMYRNLLNRFLVDMYAKVEGERLLFIRQNQKQLRAENYVHLRDAVAADGNLQNVGQLVILPSTFTGGPRYMHERTQDAMTYVRTYGKPHLFITFTCNPQWEEIRTLLHPGQKSNHRHDLIARVFRQKLVKLLHLLTKQHVFGATLCHMYTIEWQKRGLPHAHILLWLKDKIHLNQIDSIISAELPDPETDHGLFEVIKTQMVHGPCGPHNHRSPCMIDGKCTKGFPKQFLAETQTGNDGYPSYRRRKPSDGGFKTVISIGHSRDVEVDNRWIVPYCPLLSKVFKAHINVEFCNSVKSIKYVCKYVNKGSDMAMMGLQDANKNDEVTAYQMARYISSNEAAWRLFNFPLHERYPTVVHLAVHLENGQRIYFNPTNPQQVQDQLETPKATTLTAFFKLCQHDIFASTLLYNEVPHYYTWQQASKTWKRRVLGQSVHGHPDIKRDSALGRVYTVHPNNFECFFLRLLLHTVRGPKSFQDLKTVEGHVCETYREACHLRGLLDDDSHWDATLTEASVSSSSSQLRNLFAIMLHTCHLSNPAQLWECHKEEFCEDILLLAQRQNPGVNVQLTEQLCNDALILLEDKVMQIGGNKLQDYGLSSPNREQQATHQAMLRETSYDVNDLRQYTDENECKLHREQKAAYDRILDATTEHKGGLFFLDAPGGTGKTFLINLLLAKVRQNKKIALAVASSGIAATLLTGGRTAHSAFKLPLNLVRAEHPMCNISKGSAMANVLQQTRLIVWDECTMSHRGALEALDRTLQDIRGNAAIMGGVTVLMAGDFRQTLPVIPKGTKADELKACLKSSHLWRHVQKLYLTTNMRVHLLGDLSAATFADQLLNIGNGLLPFNSQLNMHQLPCGQMVQNLDDLKDKVFPNLEQNFQDASWMCERSILAPRNDAVNKLNLDLLQRIPGAAESFPSVDTAIDQDQAVEYPVEFLNSLQPSGMPPHNLILKTGAPIMLLRNLDPPRLCNGTRLVLKSIKRHVLEATIITGSNKGEDVFIPRIPLIPSDLPFEFKRLQFPVCLSFAITINKAQGQSMKVIGLNLDTPCFSHGQLYVACSRVGSEKCLYIHTPTTGLTTNVVYNEVL